MSLQRKRMIVLGLCDARRHHARRICHRNAVSMRLDTVELVFMQQSEQAVAWI